MAAVRPIASLPMYDWPEVRWAHDELWGAIAPRLNARGIEAPETLDRTRPSEEVWLDPGLVLSQTCGWPFATRLKNQVQLVGTPDYAVDGCRGPLYSSVIIVRKSDASKKLAEFRGRRAALNGRDSLSGFIAFDAALRRGGSALSDLDPVETGSHRASIRAVAEGRADIACIDAVCWALAQTFEADAAAQLNVIARTPLRPALPLITARSRGAAERDALREAVAEALAMQQTKPARQALFLAGLSVLNEADYAAMAAALTAHRP